MPYILLFYKTVGQSNAGVLAKIHNKLLTPYNTFHYRTNAKQEEFKPKTLILHIP